MGSLACFRILSKVWEYSRFYQTLSGFAGVCMFTKVMERKKCQFLSGFFFFLDRTFHVLLAARQILVSGFCWEKLEFLPVPLLSSLAASLVGWWETIFCILWVVQSLVLQQWRQLGLPGPSVLASLSGGLVKNPECWLNSAENRNLTLWKNSGFLAFIIPYNRIAAGFEPCTCLSLCGFGMFSSLVFQSNVNPSFLAFYLSLRLAENCYRTMSMP